MSEFKLTPRTLIWIAVWLIGLVVLAVMAVFTDITSTFAGGVLGTWCGAAIAVVLVIRERAKKQPPSPRARERYGRR